MTTRKAKKRCGTCEFFDVIFEDESWGYCLNPKREGKWKMMDEDYCGLWGDKKRYPKGFDFGLSEGVL